MITTVKEEEVIFVQLLRGKNDANEPFEAYVKRVDQLGMVVEVEVFNAKKKESRYPYIFIPWSNVMACVVKNEDEKWESYDFDALEEVLGKPPTDEDDQPISPEAQRHAEFVAAVSARACEY